MSDSSLPTNRSFGWFFAAIFFAFAAYAHWRAWIVTAPTAFLLGIILGMIAAVAPQRLSKANRVWNSIGNFLGKITSPLIMAIVFFLMITPISLITRFYGRDELKIKRRLVQSYWLDRSPAGSSFDSFKHQF